MLDNRAKKVLTLILLLCNWALVFWLQWVNDMALSSHLVVVPLLMILSTGMAALAVNDPDQNRHKDV